MWLKQNMANEAILMVETELPTSWTCANATAIPKGSILQLGDLATVSKTDGNSDVVGGIIAEEKIASDGNVKCPVYRGGIFKVMASGSITTGDALASAGLELDNRVYSITGLQTVAASGSRVIGISLEDATDGHTFLMELRPQSAPVASGTAS